MEEGVSYLNLQMNEKPNEQVEKPNTPETSSPRLKITHEKKKRNTGDTSPEGPSPRRKNGRKKDKNKKTDEDLPKDKNKKTDEDLPPKDKNKKTDEDLPNTNKQLKHKHEPQNSSQNITVKKKPSTSSVLDEKRKSVPKEEKTTPAEDEKGSQPDENCQNHNGSDKVLVKKPPSLFQMRNSNTMSLSSPHLVQLVPTNEKKEEEKIHTEKREVVSGGGGLFSFGKKKKDKEDKKANSKNIFFVSCISELPEDVKKKIKSLKLDEGKINANWEPFVYILRHVTKDSFRVPDLEIPRSDRYPNVSEEMRKNAAELIITVEKEKDIKKIFKFIETSGKGGFGRVFCARVKQTKHIVAIKRLPACTEKEELSNISEIACLTLLRHPNIVDFKSAYKYNKETWIVTEYMEGGTLSQAIKVHALSEQHMAYVTQQLLKGLSFMHSNGFVHRDLKSNNIMLSIAGNIKLIDFGLCADLSDGPRAQMLGTAYWMSPEMIKRLPHTTKADVWSLGIVVLEMLLRGPPFASSRMLSMFKAVCGETLDILDSSHVKIGDKVRSFLMNCVQPDPDVRLSCNELLKHSWVSNAVLDKELIVVLRTVFVSITLYKSGI